MARWVLLAFALAGAGCGPMACELFTTSFELDYCVQVNPFDPFHENLDGYTCYYGETCPSLGYTLPCPLFDGSTYWKRTGARC
ncbi:MAG TPA: hypothetical protein VIV59_05815 [Anaeromyxobacteraceae bacterium]